MAVCPMLAIASGMNSAECGGERCEWFNIIRKRCAIATLADDVESLNEEIAELSEMLTASEKET